MKKQEIHHLRENYTKGELLLEDLLDSPLRQFDVWFNHALNEKVKEANVMSISTIGIDGGPSSRIVLLKEMTEEGFVFYTNQESDKGKEIAENSQVALLFFWQELERQVRIRGKAEKVSDAVATKYFQSRPKGSQIGAWASYQSQKLEDRIELEKRVANLTEKYKDQDVLPKPPYWGGYIVRPTSLEFWQGRDSRLHDRFRYDVNVGGLWTISRLSP